MYQEKWAFAIGADSLTSHHPNCTSRGNDSSNVQTSILLDGVLVTDRQQSLTFGVRSSSGSTIKSSVQQHKGGC